VRAEERIFVALDTPDYSRARRLVTELRDYVGGFKVGSQLFVREGPRIISSIKEEGRRIFLDLKFHDIPSTVARTAEQVVRLGVSIFNLHIAGGYEMMRACVEACQRVAQEESLLKPSILGVTVLTSLSQEELGLLGITHPLEELVVQLALLAKRAGLDGVVASPREVRLVREALGQDFIIMCPGVRSSANNIHDHRRAATPREAIEAGADYIVIGRPILEAPDPVAACQDILQELQMGSI